MKQRRRSEANFQGGLDIADRTGDFDHRAKHVIPLGLDHLYLGFLGHLV